MENTVLGSRYRLTEKVGTGGMADVYRALDEVLGRTVAVKVMHAQYAADPAFAARFHQEAKAAAGLQSPHIVTIHDWGEDDSTYFIVMEYLEGEDLGELIGREGALPSIRVSEIGLQVSAALSVAHSNDVIHRDVTARNIMVTPDGSVKVTDFGIARMGNGTMTQTGTVLGSAAYLSPEQAQGGVLGPATDLYSLGVVLFEAATGHLPFEGDSPVAVAFKQVNESPPRPRDVNASIDPRLEAIIVKAMAKRAEDRFATAEEMRQSLLSVTEGQGLDATAVLPAAEAQTAVLPAVPRAQSDAGATRATAHPSRLWLWLLLAAFTVVLGIAVMLSLPSGEPATVPDVGGRQLDEASAALVEAGFDLGSVTEEFDAEAPEGQVVSQTPAADETATKGTGVDLVVSKGPRMVTVPDVVGNSEQDGRSAIAGAGFVPEALAPESSSGVEAGTILRQEPSAGGQATEGSTVGYVISTGDPAPSDDEKPGQGRGRDKNSDDKDDD